MARAWSAASRTLAVVVLGLAGAAGLLALGRAVASATTAACTVSWVNPVSGSWDLGPSWSTGAVPGEADDVCIDVPGTYQVTLTGPASIRSLTLGARTGAPTLAVLGGGPSPTGARLSLGMTSTIGLGAVLEVDGTGPGLTAELYGPGGIVNHGTVQLGQSSGFSVFEVRVGNGADGLVHVTSGSRWLASSLVNDGAVVVDAGAQLTLGYGSFASNAGSSLQLAGSFTGIGTTFTQVGGTVSGDPSSSAARSWSTAPVPETSSCRAAARGPACGARSRRSRQSPSRAKPEPSPPLRCRRL